MTGPANSPLAPHSPPPMAAMTTAGRSTLTRHADDARSASQAITPRADAAFCEAVVRSHARTFALASYFLPAAKRRASFALYAFCRVADDMVDSARSSDDLAGARQLAEYDRQLALAVAGRPSGPIFRELSWAVREYGIPEAVLHDLLDGVARDLRPIGYATWPALALYCEGVASTVGEMCTYAFGVPGGADARRSALRYARALGVAMQLTNILRDVGEDARRGRCYLPDEDLAQFGLARSDVMAAANGADGRPSGAPKLADDPRWKRFMQFEVQRARALYEAAIPGIALLSEDSRRCASACAWGYAGILGAIEDNGYDTLQRRARVGGWARLSVLWEAWRSKSEGAVAPIGEGPALEWDGARGLDDDELLRWA